MTKEMSGKSGLGRGTLGWFGFGLGLRWFWAGSGFQRQIHPFKNGQLGGVALTLKDIGSTAESGHES